MICLKNRTFAVSQTTIFNGHDIEFRLWFAWKIVLLQYHKQQVPHYYCIETRCDLLEKSYFCSITNNLLSFLDLLRLVVICLKNRTFAVSQTTTAPAYLLRNSCDLLEKSYFCSITNNRCVESFGNALVVICLKNRTFAVSQTTRRNLQIVKSKLWFAWKIVLLQYHKQLDYSFALLLSSCDLLEKSYFCSITNNTLCRNLSLRPVVICLKNRTFAVSQTTYFLKIKRQFALWFAWKIVLLQYHKQRYPATAPYPCCCDLLEKSYFCSITNN